MKWQANSQIYSPVGWNCNYHTYTQKLTVSTSTTICWASQVAQWWRIHLAMQETKRRGFDPWVGKIPWRRKGNPLQSSCLGNPTDRGAWWATAHGVTKSQTHLWLSTCMHVRAHTHTHTHTHTHHYYFQFDSHFLREINCLHNQKKEKP